MQYAAVDLPKVGEGGGGEGEIQQDEEANMPVQRDIAAGVGSRIRITTQ